jgi:hypothetical protein
LRFLLKLGFFILITSSLFMSIIPHSLPHSFQVKQLRFSKGKKVKLSMYRPGEAPRFPGGWGSLISRQSTHDGGKVVSPTHRPPLPPPPPRTSHDIRFC